MGNISKILLLASVCLVGIGILFTGGVAAEEAPLEELEGEGTEDDPYVITDVEELQAMNEDLEAHYVLGNDIDASETQTWEAGAGFEPIGDENAMFSGTVDGQGHTIDGLVIQRPGDDWVGLIGVLDGEIADVRLEGTIVSGSESVGVVAGENRGTITDVSVQGEVYGNDDNVGGLVGISHSDATIDNSSATVRVDGDNEVGGLVGSNEGTITWSSASGDVSGGENDKWQDNIGGLVGVNSGPISNSYATGDIIDGERNTGGLIGLNAGPVRNAYATGDVYSDSRWVGGLVGGNGESLTNVYSTGDVSGDEYVGGLTGSSGTVISNAYTISSVDGDDTVGGVIGRGDGPLRNTYWNKNAVGQEESLGEGGDQGTALTAPEMTGPAASANMNGLDMDDVWAPTDEYPILQMQIDELEATVSDETLTAGRTTDIEVTLELTDGTSVSATEVAEYETGELTDVTAGHVDTHQSGTGEITVTVGSETDTVELEITEPPNIELEDAALEAPAVVEGNEVTVTATYANDGGPGSHTAELVVDGETVASDPVWVGADDETTVGFEWTPAGDADTEYDVAIDDTDLRTLTVVDADAVSLESVSIPEQVGSGTSYAVTADLATDHDESVLATVVYELGSEDTASKPVVIDPDGSTAVFDREVDANVGTSLPQTVTLAGETLERTSEVAAPPAFEITALEAPDEAEAGEEFALTVTVENTGDLEGTQPITVADEGDDRSAEELTVAAGATETVSMTVSESNPGDYEYTVSSADDETAATVSVTEDNETNGGETDDADSDSSDGSDGMPGLGPTTAVVALLVAVVVAIRRP